MAFSLFTIIILVLLSIYFNMTFFASLSVKQKKIWVITLVCRIICFKVVIWFAWYLNKKPQ